MAYVSNQKFITKCFEGTEQEFEIKFRRMTAAESVQHGRAALTVYDSKSEELIFELMVDFLCRQIVEIKGFFVQEEIETEPYPITLVGATESERREFFEKKCGEPIVVREMYTSYFNHVEKEIESRTKK